jgi:hypothetical protein
MMAGGFVILRIALKREIEGAVTLDPEEDHILRMAFGQFGGSAKARADAIPIVRRLQTTDRGYWILCDCRPAQSSPPTLVPVLETYLRRHVTEDWPQHAEACEFFRDLADQAEVSEISKSYQPLAKSLVRLVRSFEIAAAASPERLENVSKARRRPQLARLLVRLLTEAGLQKVEPGFKPPPIPEQMKAIWPVARDISLDQNVRMADAMCMSVAKLPALMDQIATRPDETYRHTRPHGVLLVRVQAVRTGLLRTLNGEELPVTGRLAVFGDRPEDEPGAGVDARSPYLALCIVARPAPRQRVQIVAAYVHPCASLDRLMLVDSDAERQTLSMLKNFQYALLKKSGAVVTIEKPMDSLAPDQGADGTPLRPIIPDFIVTARERDGQERRVVIETMGYSDQGYRERKARLHPEMQRAADAVAVITHDFHEPGPWQQEWRDNRFRRNLWRILGNQEESV